MVLCAIFLFIVLGGSSSPPPDQAQTPPPPPAAQAPAPAKPVPPKTEAQKKQEAAAAAKRQAEHVRQVREKEAQAKASKRAEAAAAVHTFSAYQDVFKGHLLVYHSILQQIGSGEMDPATGYNKLESLHTMSVGLFGRARELEVPEKYSQEKETMVQSASYLENSIGEALKYMDDKKISTLAEAQKDMQEAMKGNELVSMGVASKAIADGWSPPNGSARRSK